MPNRAGCRRAFIIFSHDPPVISFAGIQAGDITIGDMDGIAHHDVGGVVAELHEYIIGRRIPVGVATRPGKS